MKTQMELGIDGCPKSRAIVQRRRVPGARWWFQQMHTVVDQAFDWTGPKARPEQIYLSLGATKPFKPCA
jgi:hypothetical protein